MGLESAIIQGPVLVVRAIIGLQYVHILWLETSLSEFSQQGSSRSPKIWGVTGEALEVDACNPSVMSCTQPQPPLRTFKGDKRRGFRMFKQLIQLNPRTTSSRHTCHVQVVGHYYTIIIIITITSIINYYCCYYGYLGGLGRWPIQLSIRIGFRTIYS